MVVGTHRPSSFRRRIGEDHVNLVQPELRKHPLTAVLEANEVRRRIPRKQRMKKSTNHELRQDVDNADAQPMSRFRVPFDILEQLAPKIENLLPIAEYPLPSFRGHEPAPSTLQKLRSEHLLKSTNLRAQRRVGKAQNTTSCHETTLAHEGREEQEMVEVELMHLSIGPTDCYQIIYLSTRFSRYMMVAMPALHAPPAVFSLRHAPSWLLLAFAAGSVNAIAFLACARFVTHVTGTVSRIGMDANSIFLALDYCLVLGCFVIGAMVSTMLLEGRHVQKKQPLYAAPLIAVAALLAMVAFAGVSGWFGEFGGSVEGPRDFALLSILAFAMGLQNAAVATSTGLLVRTTHMTGPATDLGIHLVTAVYADGQTRHTALRHAALRAGKIAAFALGAGAGAALVPTAKYASFLLPSVIIAGATVLSFVKMPEQQQLPQAAR